MKNKTLPIIIGVVAIAALVYFMGGGDKTAKKLLGLYGSMEGLYENTHELKGKQKEKVEDNKELAFLSKKLATINLAVPVDFEAENLQRVPMNKEAVKELFLELEFRRLAERWFGKETTETTPKPKVQKKQQIRHKQIYLEAMMLMNKTCSHQPIKL